MSKELNASLEEQLNNVHFMLVELELNSRLNHELTIKMCREIRNLMKIARKAASNNLKEENEKILTTKELELQVQIVPVTDNISPENSEGMVSPSLECSTLT